MDKTTIELIKDMAACAYALADTMKKLADHLEKESVTSVAELARKLKTLRLDQ